MDISERLEVGETKRDNQSESRSDALCVEKVSHSLNSSELIIPNWLRRPFLRTFEGTASDAHPDSFAQDLEVRAESPFDDPREVVRWMWSISRYRRRPVTDKGTFVGVHTRGATHAHRIVGAAEAPICLAAVTIIVPHGNSMRALGAELVEHGVDFQAAREEAERRAKAGGLEMVPSFHRDLVRGAATYALELFNAVPDLAPLYVLVGA